MMGFSVTVDRTQMPAAASHRLHSCTGAMARLFDTKKLKNGRRTRCFSEEQ